MKPGARVIISADPRKHQWQGQSWLSHHTVPHALHPFNSVSPAFLKIAVRHLTSFSTSAQLGTPPRAVLEDDTSTQEQIFVFLLISKAQLSLYPQSRCTGEKCDQSILETTKNDLQELFLALLGHEIMDIKIMTLLYIEKLF